MKPLNKGHNQSQQFCPLLGGCPLLEVVIFGSIDSVLWREVVRGSFIRGSTVFNFAISTCPEELSPPNLHKLVSCATVCTNLTRLEIYYCYGTVILVSEAGHLMLACYLM